MRAHPVWACMFLGILATMHVASAQESNDAAQLAQVEAQLQSTWWGKVQGEVDPRIVRITRIGLRDDGNFDLELNFGVPGSGQVPLKGTLIRLGLPTEAIPNRWIGAKTYKLEFTTGAGTVISAESAGPGSFVGTFTTRSGSIRPIELEGVSEQEVKARTNGAYAGRRAAAHRWLNKDEIKIDYEGRWKWTIPVDMKKMTATFYYPVGDYCTAAPVPAEVRVDGEGMLVFLFDSRLPGCAQLQYVFDPISKSGVIRRRPAGSSPDDPWSGPSSARVSLID